MEKNHDVFIRLVGRVMGALDLAHADENLKQTVKAYIWQAERDLSYEKNTRGVDNNERN